MIMADDDIVCENTRRNNFGYHALYDVCEDSELSSGVVLCSMVKGEIYIFQLENTTDILSEESVMVMEGTLFECFDDKPCEEIDYFPISNCRFPTRDELEWYNKMDTV